MEGSPASAAGLKTGDIILNFANKDVSGPRNLQGIVEQLVVGKSYMMELLRDGKRINKNVTMKECRKASQSRKMKHLLKVKRMRSRKPA